MSGDSDIAAIITAETDDFSGPILEAQATAESFFTYIVDGGKQALSAMGSALATLASDIASETKAVLLEVGHGMAATALEAALFGTAVVGTTSYFAGLWNTMRMGMSVASWFVPWLKVVTLSLAAATVATYAYGAADEYLNGELSNSLGGFTQTSAAIDEFKATISETGESLGIVGDGIGSVGASLVKLAVDWSGLGAAVQAVDSGMAAAVTFTTEAVNGLNQSFQNTTDAITDWLSSAGAGAAALREMAAASEELMAKQQAMSAITGQIRAMQDEAAASAAHSAEIQRIGSLDSVQAVNEEINALQQKSAALALAAVEGAAAQAKLDAMKPPSEEDNVGRGKAESLRKIAEEGEAAQASLQKTGALFTALENQKNKINSGGMDKPKQATAGESAIAQAEQALRRMTLGQDEAAISTLIASGATQKEIDTLRELQAEIAEVNAAEQQRAQVERDVAEAVANAQREAEKEAADAQRIQDQGENRIQGMLDQIDLLTGAATKAEIEMRKMARAGFSQEQIDEVGALQAELDALEANKQKSKSDKSSPLKAAFKGSQEAASIMLRGVGGGKSVEAIAQKQLTVQQQTLIAIKANKPEPLAALTV